jgi:glutathione-regulated potassium-efflux system protein KefB
MAPALNVLHASGASSAKAIIVCVDKREAATDIARLVQAEFPLAKLLVRSYDLEHALTLSLASQALAVGGVIR